MQTLDIKPLFSLIIPCHNPEKTINRLFDSLTKQSISNKDLEIILVDDNSDNLNYQNYLQQHYNFNINFVKTNTSIHCPGNTRKEGMKYINGQWLFFCDQDDILENNTLKQIKEYIEKNPSCVLITTKVKRMSEDLTQCYSILEYPLSLLHGKWYSINKLIKPFNIDFKQDLQTHEDIFFNSEITNALIKLNKEADKIDIFSYLWIQNKDSISVKEAFTSPRGYLYDKFEDYLTAIIEPYWKDAVKQQIDFITLVIDGLLHAYFYYEVASYYYGPDKYKDVLQLIQNLLFKIQKEIKLELKQIINFVYRNPQMYLEVLKDCEIMGYFIPKTSFRDFIFYLGKGENK